MSARGGCGVGRRQGGRRGGLTEEEHRQGQKNMARGEKNEEITMSLEKHRELFSLKLEARISGFTLPHTL